VLTLPAAEHFRKRWKEFISLQKNGSHEQGNDHQDILESIGTTQRGKIRESQLPLLCIIYIMELTQDPSWLDCGYRKSSSEVLFRSYVTIVMVKKLLMF
jgi:hypothetical protein